jgi:hypothetical protein
MRRPATEPMTFPAATDTNGPRFDDRGRTAPYFHLSKHNDYENRSPWFPGSLVFGIGVGEK